MIYVEAFHQEWNRWLARGEPFATLRLFVDTDSTVQPPGAPVFVKQWLQTHSLLHWTGCVSACTHRADCGSMQMP